MGVAGQHDRQVARDGEARADVGGLDRQLATAAVDEHGELDRAGRPKSNSSLIAARTLRPVNSTSSTSTIVAPSTSKGSSVRRVSALRPVRL